MKEQKIGEWDNLKIGHIPNEVEQLNRMKNILFANYISGNGVSESNTIKKNVYNRNLITQ